MPYEGVRHGPGAFLSGVTNGMTSLLRHVSTGELSWSLLDRLNGQCGHWVVRIIVLGTYTVFYECFNEFL